MKRHAQNIPVERDYVRAHWLLGAAYRLNGDLAQAEQHLSEALTRCRNINMVEHGSRHPARSGALAR